MGGILLGEVFWKQILHKSIINIRRPVLIGRPTLDIEDGLADCLYDMWEEGFEGNEEGLLLDIG